MNQNNDWQNSEKDMLPAWQHMIDGDTGHHFLDWQWLRSLDLHNGVGLHDFNDPMKTYVHDSHVLQKMDDAVEVLSRAWMFDRHRELSTYGLVLAYAYAMRRLNDEIDYCRELMTLRNMDIPDTSVRKYHARHEMRERSDFDWHDRYLPGRQVSTVVGIDLETTGLNSYHDYVIDAGYEYMDMASSADGGVSSSYRYQSDGYEVDGAYGQQRHSYGVSPLRSSLGIPTEELTGISSDDVIGYRPLDDDPIAQRKLLRTLVSAPFVAHNASFEHHHFMSNIRGYAEMYRDGKITIIDTMSMSRRWGHVLDDDGGGKRKNNKLETYAKTWGGLRRDASERHLGLEDAHIMLVAMRNNLDYLKKNNMGPWSQENQIPGVGGKSCGKS